MRRSAVTSWKIATPATTAPDVVAHRPALMLISTRCRRGAAPRLLAAHHLARLHRARQRPLVRRQRLAGPRPARVEALPVGAVVLHPRRQAAAAEDLVRAAVDEHEAPGRRLGHGDPHRRLLEHRGELPAGGVALGGDPLRLAPRPLGGHALLRQLRRPHPHRRVGRLELGGLLAQVLVGDLQLGGLLVQLRRLHLELRRLLLQLLVLHRELLGLLGEAGAVAAHRPVQAGALQRRRRAARQLGRRLQLRRAVAAPPLGRHEGQRPHHPRPPVGDRVLGGDGRVRRPGAHLGGEHRHDDVRAQPERAQRRQVLRVARALLEQRVGDVGGQLGPPGAQDVRDAHRRVGRGRVALGERLREGHLRRVDVGHRHAARHPRRARAVGRQVDAAPVGELGHGERRDRRERLLDVERRAEHGAGAGEQRQRGLVALGRVDVGAGAEPARDAPGVVAERDGARQEPAVRAARRLLEAGTRPRTGRPVARQCAQRSTVGA
jgi:hypothetical protein